VAIQTLKPDPFLVDPQGKEYILQWSDGNGNVRIIEKGAPTGTTPIFSNGTWNDTLATQANIPQSTQISVYQNVQSTLKNAHAAGGGNGNGLVLPQWITNSAAPPGVGTSTIVPSPGTSPNSGNSNGNTILDLFNTITNPQPYIKAVSINNGGYGPANQFKLFAEPMKYPTDMMIAHQDYVLITQYQYKPPKSDQLLSGDVGSILQKGFQKTANFNKEKKIGDVYLPMPGSVRDQMQVTWGPDTMSNISGAVTADVMNRPKDYASAALTGAGTGVFFGGAKQGASLATSALAYQALLSNLSGDEAKALVGTTGVSKILGMASFGVDVESILARTAGIVPNNNLDLLFNGPQLRSFSFNYKMTARDEKEAKMIRRIIRFFKQGSAPKKKTGGAGASSYFLATPNVFKIKFCVGGGAENKAISRYKVCALQSVTTNYTAAGPMWAAYDDGQPLMVGIDLVFSELEPIFDTDYQTDAIPGTGLEPVQDDAVGY